MSSNQQPPQTNTQSTPTAGSQQKPAGLPSQQPSTAPQIPGASGGVAANTIPFLGCKISLISKSGIRYEGILHNIDTRNSTVALRMVRMFGTEGRRDGQQIPAIDKVFEFISFKGPDIKDLTVCETPAQQSSAPIGTREESPAQQGAPQQSTPQQQPLPTNPQFGSQFPPKPFPQSAPSGMMPPGQPYNPYFQNAFNPFYMQPPMPFQPTGFPPAGHPISGSLYKPPTQGGAPSTSQPSIPSQTGAGAQQSVPQGGQKPATTAVPQKPAVQPTIKAPQPQPQPQIITPPQKKEVPIVEAKPIEPPTQTVTHDSESSVFDDNRHMLPPRGWQTNTNQQPQRGRGRGGFAPRGRGGRGGRGRGGFTAKIQNGGTEEEIIDQEFDFDAANAKLDKESIKKELNIMDDKDTISKKVYNKSESFFDNISREASSEARTREEREEQYRTDTETFGASTVASHKHQQRGHHRGRGGFQPRGRGGFQSRGGRGGPRGGRGGQRGGFSQQFS